MNAQDLSAYELGFDLEMEILTMNRYIEYMDTDGSSPCLMEVYVSTDYSGDFENATWTEITNQLESNIDKGGFIEGNEFAGLPYPGDQNLVGLPNPDGLKDPAKNADGKWVRSTFNMVDYIGMSNVTFAVRVYTTFPGESIAYTGGRNRIGRFLISDFNVKGREQ
ncbi:hypothetical protein JCM19274_2768 [Algibacter lectus]|uniref:Uncharacterized protein n=1 Tax=Algibacter lectus TaxID=221126 RepID=A0A090X6X8_9FLAO|nr:hypothetical protein [Algibacter lectus]GAL82057.1 hypothetical protein JCM19274_2768 [Algibacter lectus]